MRRSNSGDIFSIPVGKHFDQEDSKIRILYSPLADSLMLASDEDAARIMDCIDGAQTDDAETREAAASLLHTLQEMDAERIPDLQKIAKLSVMPNYVCNFRCSYCYSAKGRSSGKLAWEKAEKLLRWFVSRERFAGEEVPVLSLFISGGGEPLTTWEELTYPLLTLARSLADSQGIQLRISMITNGSLLTDNIAQTLHEQRCAVGLSFEVLKPLQDQQRGHYEQVAQHLDLLRKHNVVTRINCTITPLSVHSMVGIVETVASHWNFIQGLTMEPATGKDLFASASELRSFYDSYLENYLASRQRAGELGVKLRFTYDDAFRGTAVRHCPGKFCLTPMGTISVCHLVTSPREERYAQCVYGHVDEEGIHLDTEKFAGLYRLNMLHYDGCKTCFAKWVCGGECLTRRETYPADYFAEVCRFNRNFLTLQLLRQIEKEVMETTGSTLREYVLQ